MKKGDFLKFLNGAQVSKGKRDRVPFLPRDQQAINLKQNPPSQPTNLPSTSLFRTGSDVVLSEYPEQCDFNASFSQPLPNTKEDDKVGHS